MKMDVVLGRLSYCYIADGRRGRRDAPANLCPFTAVEEKWRPYLATLFHQNANIHMLAQKADPGVRLGNITTKADPGVRMGKHTQNIHKRPPPCPLGIHGPLVKCVSGEMLRPHEWGQGEGAGPGCACSFVVSFSACAFNWTHYRLQRHG